MTGELAPVADAEGVRTVTFNRPAVRNAFDQALYRAVTGALAAARDDDAVRAVVLTGAGTAFSAGQDLREMAAIATGEVGEGAAFGFRALLAELDRFDKPLLAAVNGVAVGLGMTVLPYCDLVLFDETARCKVPFASLGVPPEAGSSYLFAATMGPQRAARVLFTGDWLDATEAVAAGLALAVCPAGTVLAETQALAGRIATAPLAALVEMKRLVLAARADATAAARRREESAFARLLGGPDNLAALDAAGRRPGR